jgi:hypothetical protein
MPVKISSIASDDPRVISLDEYQFGRDNFRMHYYKAPDAEISEFGGQDFTVPWSDFYQAVYDFYTSNNINPEDVALRFVHCYDQSGNCLFLRMQICTLGTPYNNPQGYQVFPLETTPCAWYELRNGAITITTDTTLKGVEYFDNMYYKADPGADEYQQLSDAVNTYVENLSYPWYTEIYQMYVDNNEPANADIHFASCSYTQPVMDPNVTWPHGSVMYLSEGSHIYLDNEDYIVVFSNKGCDDGTPCPPNCNVYVNPVLPS